MSFIQHSRIGENPSPDSNFFISLQEPNRGYRPNDTLRGDVVAVGELPSQPTAVHITLEGRCKTKIELNGGTKHATFRSRIPLVYNRQELAPSPVEEFGLQRYSHAVQVPPSVQNLKETYPFTDRYWSHSVERNEVILETGPGRALPSTLAFGPRGGFRRVQGYVEYKLVAARSWVLPTQGMGADGQTTFHLEPFKSAQCGFWFVSFVADSMLNAMSNITSHLDIKSFCLDSSTAITNLSVSQRFKQALGTSSVPTVKFSVLRSIQRCLWIGKPVVVSVTLGAPKFEEQAWKQRRWVTVMPMDATIVEVRLVLKRRFGVAASSDSDQYYDTVLDQKFEASAPKNGSDRFFRTAEGYSAVTATFGPVPANLTPSSFTVNLSYRYESWIHVKIACGGEVTGQQQGIYTLVGHMSRHQIQRIRAQNSSSPVVLPQSPPGPPLTPEQEEKITIRRKPVGTASHSMTPVPPPRLMSFQASDTTENDWDDDALRDLGPFKVDADEVDASIKTFHNTLRAMDYTLRVAGYANMIRHAWNVVGFVG